MAKALALALFLSAAISGLALANLVAPDYFPSLRSVSAEFWGGLRHHRYLSGQDGWMDALGSSALATIIAVTIGAIGALLVSLAIWPWCPIRRLFRHVIDLVRVVPPLVSVPFLLCIFAGHGSIPAIAAASGYAFLGSVVYAYASIESTDPVFDGISRLYGIRGLRRSLRLRLPAVLPHYIAHLRIILSLTLGIVVVTEYFQDRGLGYALRVGQDKHSLPTIAVTILLSIFLLFLVDIAIGAILPVFRVIHVIQWHYPALAPWHLTVICVRAVRSLLRNTVSGLSKSIGLAVNLPRRMFRFERVPIWVGMQFGVTFLGVSGSLAGFWIVWSQLDSQRVAQAWQVIAGAAGKRGEDGRLQAIERLTKAHRNLTGTDLSNGYYQGAVIRSAFLDSASFETATLRDIEFVSSNLFRTTFRNARITAAKFTDCEFSNADFTGGSELVDTEFANRIPLRRDDRISGQQALFRESSLRKVSFEGVSLSGADFRGATGTQLLFINCDLHGARFHGAHLQGEFRRIRANQATIFAGAVLEGARFIESELNSCDFSGADLRQTSFVRSTLSAVNFLGADLRRARFDIPSGLSDSDLDGLIQNIRLANVSGLLAPQGFREWAISRGAVDEPNTERWRALRRTLGSGFLDESSTSAR